MKTPNTAQRRWAEGQNGIPERPCPAGCGALFFTRVGVAEHVRLGCGDHPFVVTSRSLSPTEPRVRTEAQRRAWAATGAAICAKLNAQRVRCAECPKESTPAGLAAHQRFTGHLGRAEQ